MILDFLALLDGILNNELFKSNNREEWNNLIIKLGLNKRDVNHVHYLRQRWVAGASEWMAGKNGSLQNHKELFGYDDDEWYHIWSTMKANGAWNAPPLKDHSGNIIKENYAPEILIKYIAHELKCHLIIFDLQLWDIQFCSGNYLEKDNVLFDTPLILYATGNHFQTVMPIDSKVFIDLANQLENETGNIAEERNEAKTSVASKPSNNIQNRHTEVKEQTLSLEELKCIKHKTPQEKKLYDKLRKQAQRSKKSLEEKEKTKLHDRARQANNRQNQTSEKRERLKELTKERMLNKTLDEKKEQKLANKERMSSKRANQTPEEREKKKNQDKERKANYRQNQTLEKRERLKELAKERMSLKRANQTPEEREKKKLQDKERKANKRQKETSEVKKSVKEIKMRQMINKKRMSLKRRAQTIEEKNSQKLKDKEYKKVQKDAKIKTKTASIRIQNFKMAVRYGPIFPCCSCEQMMFENGVVKLEGEILKNIHKACKKQEKNLFSRVFGVKLNDPNYQVSVPSYEQKVFICHTCKKTPFKRETTSNGSCKWIVAQTCSKRPSAH